MQQIIKEPVHITNTSSSSIDLIFTSQPNLITDSGVQSSLHANCHHQIVFAKFNLHIVYPPPYLCEIWHYREANTRLDASSKNLIRKEHFWPKASMKKLIFLITILNIPSNFIPHEIIVCTDKDPPWFNKRIKTLNSRKKMLHIRFHAITKIANPDLIYCLKFLQERLKTLWQLVWRLLLRWKNVLDWKKCPISMFSEIFSPYKHVLAALFRK